jgi:undecaprenyl diphosphate synthase
MEGIDLENLPRHIAVIMDGNGRWAESRRLGRIRGHRKGVEAAREVVRVCSEIGIGALTLYTFSRENWNRPKKEVDMLMGFLESHLKSETPMMMEKGIRFRAVGNLSELPDSVLTVVKGLEDLTSSNSGMLLQLALSYSAREEITQACKSIAQRVKSGELAPEDIDEQTFEGALYTSGTPDPDLLIRTSGEMRLSNFMLWQVAYTEIYVTDVLWPDFNRSHLLEAIRSYQGRERRFGLTTEQVAG